jgi:hypothetical protein
MLHAVWLPEITIRQGHGNWKRSDSFNAGDLLLLAKVADQAHSEIYKLRANEPQTQPEDQAA